MPLLDDICRCHDDACTHRYGCARWIERGGGTRRTPHSWSLYPYVHNSTGHSLAAEWPEPCENLIEAPHG